MSLKITPVCPAVNNLPAVYTTTTTGITLAKHFITRRSTSAGRGVVMRMQCDVRTTHTSQVTNEIFYYLVKSGIASLDYHLCANS